LEFMMDTNPPTALPERDLINALGRQLVTDVAPAELPLFGAMVRARPKAGHKGTSRATRRGHGDLLGFGLGEEVALMTPLVLQFAQTFWLALNEQAVEASLGVVGSVLRRVRQRFGSEQRSPSEQVRFTEEELRHVREVGRRCAARLQIDAGQQELLVEALVGALAVPASPAAVEGR
jgi:hypothetical protein